MGEFFGLVSAFFGWAFSGIGTVFAALAAIPLLLLIVPVIVLGFFIMSITELIPPKSIREINKLEPGSDLRKNLEEIYRDEIAEWKKESISHKILYAILYFLLLVSFVLGIYASNL